VYHAGRQSEIVKGHSHARHKEQKLIKAAKTGISMKTDASATKNRPIRIIGDTWQRPAAKWRANIAFRAGFWPAGYSFAGYCRRCGGGLMTSGLMSAHLFWRAIAMRVLRIPSLRICFVANV